MVYYFKNKQTNQPTNQPTTSIFSFNNNHFPQNGPKFCRHYFCYNCYLYIPRTSLMFCQFSKKKFSEMLRIMTIIYFSKTGRKLFNTSLLENVYQYDQAGDGQKSIETWLYKIKIKFRIWLFAILFVIIRHSLRNVACWRL